MNIRKSEALAKIVNTYGLTRLEVIEGDVKIVIEKNVPASIVPPAFAPPVSEAPFGGAESNIIEVKSPITGIYYAAPAPEAPPFVIIGSKVKKGDVLCIVEAMKLLNEIQAEQDGEIIDICVKSGDIAEFGQVLFKMR